MLHFGVTREKIHYEIILQAVFNFYIVKITCMYAYIYMHAYICVCMYVHIIFYKMLTFHTPTFLILMVLSFEYHD